MALGWIANLDFKGGTAPVVVQVRNKVVYNQTSMGTMATAFNKGAKQTPSYVFSNPRRAFVQPGDKEF